MDTKKISFGFSKLAKKPSILPSKQPKEENKVELIKCLEGKEIKLVAEKVEAAPLVIEMQGSQKTSSALASLMKRRAVLLGEEEPDPEEVTPAAQSIAEVTAGCGTESLEQRAARELLAASQKNGDEGLDGQKLVLPAVKADELPLDGAKEATLDDYDNIPIQQFGLAMLRGMGWVDPPPKKKGSGPIDDAPFLRPKGMGLGADKALKPKALLVQPEKNEVLEIKKQAYVRILGGKQKDQYGQIEGFDDHAGRVIVKMAIGGAKEAFNEFLCQPVSRKEYAQYGKCINSAKYEEFKKQENEHGQIIVKQEKSPDRKNSDRKDESNSRRDAERDRKNIKSEEHRSNKEDDRRRYKNEDNRSYDKKTYKDEDKKSYKYDEKRSYKDEDKKAYKDEDRRPYKEDDRKAYKTEHRSDRNYKEESNSRKVEDRDRKKYVQDSQSNSSSTSRREERSRYRSPSPRSNSSSISKREERDRRRSQSPKSSRRAKSSSDEADDTGESTESDSDSAYERRKHKKKSSSRKSRKHSKKSKSKSKRADNDSSEDSDDSQDDDHRRHSSKHKKKTKKSKHVRSRTRSRSRGRGR
ncbi:splicing regulatory glutamine/lysine-rich protein 1 [Drosophila ficusphila]|uniref:splicing regulatory glutamine/lysine-rich protein 1 n=1 Tax=Drosophila ficusphila TaxID=30025 RepID=UPI0007E6E45A|nr:splicing regulatory glutamine/lysine-rich protein 1 [Drosophila ficusphila]